MSEADPARRLSDLLQGRGLPWAAPIEYFPVLGSTSDHAKERARAGAVEWTVAWAGRQTAGRGRHGHDWVSPPGNLFLSVVLRPPAKRSERTSALPLMAGVAVAEAVQEWGVDTRLKWPNDVLAGGRKLAGILVEGLSSADGLDAAVVGIGVNLSLGTSGGGPGSERRASLGTSGGGPGPGRRASLDADGLPSELRDHVTSVAGETARAPELAVAAAAVLHRLTVWYHALAREEDGLVRVLAAWRERAVPWWGRPVEVIAGGSVLRGRALDIDRRGALILERDDGSRVAVVSGEARELRPVRPAGP